MLRPRRLPQPSGRPRPGRPGPRQPGQALSWSSQGQVSPGPAGEDEHGGAEDDDGGQGHHDVGGERDLDRERQRSDEDPARDDAAADQGRPRECKVVFHARPPVRMGKAVLSPMMMNWTAIAMRSIPINRLTARYSRWPMRRTMTSECRIM